MDLGQVVRSNLARDKREGRIAGPFSVVPLQNLRISPFRIVILHLSYPKNKSVNDGKADEPLLYVVCTI